MADAPVVLINLLKVDPAKQDALIESLRRNTETVIRTLEGWKSTSLVAAADGTSVVIYSQWENAAAVDRMRSDPRMIAYFPEVAELASLESILGLPVLHQAH